MKTNDGCIYLSGLLGRILLMLLVADSAEINPHPSDRVLIFKGGGYDLEKYYDAGKETNSVQYHFQTDYPPTEVVKFCNTYLNGNGWRSSLEICQRN